MRICIAPAIAPLLVAVLLFANPVSAATGDVWLSNFFLLRIRTAAGGFSIDQRTEALQQRANNLLQESDQTPEVTLEKVGNDINIHAGGKLFATVTPADARANGTTVELLANLWAKRLRSILPKAAPIKPGVGRPE